MCFSVQPLSTFGYGYYRVCSNAIKISLEELSTCYIQSVTFRLTHVCSTSVCFESSGGRLENMIYLRPFDTNRDEMKTCSVFVATDVVRIVIR
jgi:hypothetical protein